MYLLGVSPAFYEHTAYETTLRFNSDTLIHVFWHVEIIWFVYMAYPFLFRIALRMSLKETRNSYFCIVVF